MEIAYRAEDLLYRSAGESTSLPGLEGGGAESRRKCRAAWEEWWKANEAKVDLAKLKTDEPLLGITIISEVNGGDRVWGCGADGKPRWEIGGVNQPVDVHRLPSGHLLIAEYGSSRVTERDQQGKIVWEKKVNSGPISCQRLANGNTFIATQSELLEVSRDGKTVVSRRAARYVWDAQKLPNGNVIYLTNNSTIVEMDPNGKEIRTIAGKEDATWGGVERLPNGRYLNSAKQDK